MQGLAAWAARGRITGGEGGGCIFMYSCVAQQISFEIDNLISLVTRNRFVHPHFLSRKTIVK